MILTIILGSPSAHKPNASTSNTNSRVEFVLNIPGSSVLILIGYRPSIQCFNLGCRFNPFTKSPLKCLASSSVITLLVGQHSTGICMSSKVSNIDWVRRRECPSLSGRKDSIALVSSVAKSLSLFSLHGISPKCIAVFNPALRTDVNAGSRSINLFLNGFPDKSSPTIYLLFCFLYSIANAAFSIASPTDSDRFTETINLGIIGPTP
mmetsp:Transcript_8026/g.12103  ORF Transcript_8026/g.12103 Transcript_8026/m.12103 type:complete len:207 (-) Transcript_8026:672-1292(-)